MIGYDEHTGRYEFCITDAKQKNVEIKIKAENLTHPHSLFDRFHEKIPEEMRGMAADAFRAKQKRGNELGNSVDPSIVEEMVRECRVIAKHVKEHPFPSKKDFDLMIDETVDRSVNYPGKAYVTR